MDGSVLLAGSRELVAFLKGFRGSLGRPEKWKNFVAFVKGQLSPIERKTHEPMADLQGIPARGLQRFFVRASWNEDGVRSELHRRVARKHGGPDGIFVLDETSDGKKGSYTAGVSRQYCGESGKVENCIVSVHLAYARGGFRCLLDGELFLPESWHPNPGDREVQERRRRAGIPAGVGHVSKPEIALRLLRRAVENGVPGRFATADEAYGDKPKWRREVGALGLTYVVETSPRNTHGWAQEPVPVRPQVDESRRRRVPRPSVPARELDVLRVQPDGLRFRSRVRLRVKETHKGPEIWEFKDSLFWQSRGVRRSTVAGGFCYPEVERVLVGENVRTGEVKYFLTNDLESPLEDLVAIAFSRWNIERCFQDCKQELGLNHAELRDYGGIQRHLLLTAVTYLFLQEFVARHELEKGGP
jgi:SRSO17 transposase